MPQGIACQSSNAEFQWLEQLERFDELDSHAREDVLEKLFSDVSIFEEDRSSFLKLMSFSLLFENQKHEGSITCLLIGWFEKDFSIINDLPLKSSSQKLANRLLSIPEILDQFVNHEPELLINLLNVAKLDDGSSRNIVECWLLSNEENITRLKNLLNELLEYENKIRSESEQTNFLANFRLIKQKLMSPRRIYSTKAELEPQYIESLGTVKFMIQWLEWIKMTSQGLGNTAIYQHFLGQLRKKWPEAQPLSELFKQLSWKVAADLLKNRAEEIEPALNGLFAVEKHIDFESLRDILLLSNDKSVHCQLILNQARFECPEFMAYLFFGISSLLSEEWVLLSLTERFVVPDPAYKTAFINAVLNNANKDWLNSNSLQFISKILIEIVAGLDIQSSTNQLLIENYLQALMSLIPKHSSHEQNSMVLSMLRNFINALPQALYEHLTHSPAYGELAELLAVIEPGSEQFLYILFKDVLAEVFPEALARNYAFQKQVPNLLSHWSDKDSYSIIFNWLNDELKLQFIVDCFLSLDSLSPLTRELLPDLSRKLRIEQLIELSAHTSEPLLTECVLQKNKELAELDSEYLSNFFFGISNSAPLLSWLQNPDTTIDERSVFFNTLFDRVCLNDAKRLNQLLRRWEDASSWVVVLANAAVQEEHKDCLDKLLHSSQLFADRLLQEMSDSKRLNSIHPDSFLSDWYGKQLSIPFAAAMLDVHHLASLPVEKQQDIFWIYHDFFKQWSNLKRGFQAFLDYSDPIDSHTKVFSILTEALPVVKQPLIEGLKSSENAISGWDIEFLKQSLTPLFYLDRGLDWRLQKHFKQFLAEIYRTSLINKPPELLGVLLFFVMYSPLSVTRDDKEFYQTIELDNWLSSCPISVAKEYFQTFVKRINGYNECFKVVNVKFQKGDFNHLDAMEFLSFLQKAHEPLELTSRIEILEQMGLMQLKKLYELALDSLETGDRLCKDTPFLELWINNELTELFNILQQMNARARFFPIQLFAPCVNNRNEFEARLIAFSEMDLDNDVRINILSQYLLKLFSDDAYSHGEEDISVYRDIFIQQCIELLKKNQKAAKNLLLALSPELFEKMLKYALLNPEANQYLIQIYFHHFPDSPILKAGLSEALRAYGYLVSENQLKPLAAPVKLSFNNDTEKYNQAIRLYKLCLLIDRKTPFHELLTTVNIEHFEWVQDFVMDLVFYVKFADDGKNENHFINNTQMVSSIQGEELDDKKTFYKELFKDYFSSDKFAGLKLADRVHALEWRSAAFAEPEVLYFGLISLLAGHDINDADSNNTLRLLIEKIIQRKNFEDFLKAIKAIKEFDQKVMDNLIVLLSLSSSFPMHMTFCIEGMSLDCFSQLLSQEFNQYRFLTTAVKNPEFITKVTGSKESKKTFLKILSQRKLSLDMAASLYQSASGNAQMTSLLMLHLLKYDTLLKHFYSKPFDFNGAKMDQQQDIQILLEKIDLCDLDVETIKELSPQAKHNLLCSSRFFHLWNNMEILNALDYDQKKTEFLLKEHSFSPNFINLLLPLLQNRNTEVRKYLDLLKPEPRNKWLSHMLSYPRPELFEAFQGKTLLHYLTESHLIELIRSYHYKGPKTAEFSQFILAVYEHLKSRPDPSFSPQVLWSLSLLFDEEPWQRVSNELADINRLAIKFMARNGQADCFYEDGLFNEHVAMQKLPGEATADFEAISSCFKKGLQPMLGEKNISEVQDAPEMTDLTMMDFYLLHAAKSQTLDKLINDYIQSFIGKDSRQRLYRTAQLMNSSTVSEDVKKQFFSQLTEITALHDAESVKEMLINDKDNTLFCLSRNKGFDDFIELTKKLSHLLAEKEHNLFKQDLKQARKDAMFEKSLQEMTGFFPALRTWFKRCRYYGFSGFFSPLQSRWVRGFEQEPVQHSVIESLPTEGGLSNLVENLSQALESGDTKRLVYYLTHFNRSQDLHADHIELRTKIDDYFESQKRQSAASSRQTNFVIEHLSEFKNNRHFLLELMIAHRPQEELMLRLDKTGLTREQLFLKKQFPQVAEIPQLLNNKPESSDDSLVGKIKVYGNLAATAGMAVGKKVFEQVPGNSKISKGVSMVADKAYAFYNSWRNEPAKAAASSSSSSSGPSL